MDLLDGSDPEDGGDVIDQDIENDLLGSDDDDMIPGRSNMEETEELYYEEKFEEEEEDTLDLGLDEHDDLGMAQVPLSEQRVAPVRTVVRLMVQDPPDQPEVKPNMEGDIKSHESSQDEGNRNDEEQEQSKVDLDLDDEEEEKNPRSRFHTERKTETSSFGSGSNMGAPIATLGNKQKFTNSQNENRPRGNWGNQNFRGRGSQNHGPRQNFMMGPGPMGMRPRGLLGDPPMRGGFQDFRHRRPGPGGPQGPPRIPPHHSNVPIQQFSGQIFTDFDRPMMNSNPNPMPAPRAVIHPIRNPHPRPQLNHGNQGERQMQNQPRNQNPRFAQRGPPPGNNPFLPERLHKQQPQNQGSRPPNIQNQGPRGPNNNLNRPLLQPPINHQHPIHPEGQGNFNSPPMGENKIDNVPSHPNVIITRGLNFGASPTKMHQGEPQNPFSSQQPTNGNFPRPNKSVNIPQMRNMQQQAPMSGPRPRQNFNPNPNMEMNPQHQHDQHPHFPPPHPQAETNPFLIIGGKSQDGMWPRQNSVAPIQMHGPPMGPGPSHLVVDPMRGHQFFPPQVQHQGHQSEFSMGVPFYPDPNQFVRPSMHVAPMEFMPPNPFPHQLSQGMSNRYDGPEFHQMRDQDIGARQEHFLDKLEEQRRERERTFEKKSEYDRHGIDRDWDRDRGYDRPREWDRDRDYDYKDRERSFRDGRDRPYTRDEERPFKRPNEFIPTAIPEKKRIQQRIGPPPRINDDKQEQIVKIVMETKKEMGLGLDDDYLKKLEEQKRRREEIIRQKEFNRRNQTGTKEPEGEKRNQPEKSFEQPSFTQSPTKPHSIHVNPRAFKGDLSLLKTNLKKINMDVKERSQGENREVKDERVVLLKSPSKPQSSAPTPAPAPQKVKLQAPVVPNVQVEKPKKPHTILRIVKNKKGEVISRSKVQVHLK